MQTACRVEDQSCQFPNRDKVLEQLIVEGTFDHVAPDSPNIPEEMAMHHSSAMVERLLMRIECLKSKVREWALILGRLLMRHFTVDQCENGFQFPF